MLGSRGEITFSPLLPGSLAPPAPLLPLSPPLVSERPAWAEGLHERQVEAMLYVGEHGRISNREYQDLYGVSRETAKRDLRDLVDRGLLTPVGRGRGLCYVLTRL